MSHDRRSVEVAEENRDGRTLMLLGVAGVGGLSALVAAVYGLVVLLGGASTPTDDARLELVASASVNEPATDAEVAADVETSAVQVPESRAVSANAETVVRPKEQQQPIASAVTEVTTSKETAGSKTEADNATETSPARAPADATQAATTALGPKAEPESDAAAPQPATPVAAATPSPKPGTAVPPELPAQADRAAGKAASTTEATVADRGSVQVVADAAHFEPTRKGDPLVYHWVPGEIHGYAITLTAEQNGQQQKTTGNVELTVNPGKEKSEAASKADDDEEAKPETGTGTAFVVRSDGWLVTCAHVVQGASNVVVMLGETEYPAEVIAKHADNDLALLRIKANGLVPVPLADGAAVKLGQDVRAFGFPLTTVLGEGVKVTRGSLAGILQVDAGKRFQIDAAINPGNSGGPVVDERGAVVGVASSRLVGLELTRLGFCVPSDLVSEFLQQHDVTPEGTPADALLDGPALARTVSGGVGLVRVTIDPLRATGDLFALSTSGSFRTERPRNVRGFMLPMIPDSSFDRGTVTVDANGHRESFESPEQLPFLAGPMALLTVHPLDQAGRDAWTVRESIKIVVQKRETGPGGIPVPRIPRPRIPRRFGGPRARSPFDPQVVKELDAVEVHQYRIKSDSDDLVVLEKTFSLTTLDDDNCPYFRISGTGEVTFSRKSGLIEKFSFDHRFEQNSDGKQTQIPVRIVVEREAPEIVAQRKREAATRLAELQFKQQQDAAAKAAQPAGEKLDALLEQIRDPKDQVQKIRLPQTVASLEKLPLDPARQADVEALLLEKLADSNDQIAGAAASSLKVWGSKHSVEPLIARVGDGSQFVVARGVCAALGTLGDKRAAEPLVKLLSNLSVQIYAKQALTNLGPAAEDAVLNLLSENDNRKVQLACEVLQKIGGAKSVKPLEFLANGDDFFRKTFAKRAIDEVRKRAADEQAIAAAKQNGDAAGLTPQHIQTQRLLDSLRNGNGNSFSRHQALTELGKQARVDALQPEVEALLLSQLVDGDKTLRLPTLTALKAWASEKSSDPLLTIILDPEQSQLQAAAIDALKPIATQVIADRLVEQAGDQVPSYALRQLIKQTGVTETGELALGQLATLDENVERNHLIDVLAAIGSPVSLPLLDSLSQSPKPTTRLYAAAVAAAKIRLRNGL